MESVEAVRLCPTSDSAIYDELHQRALDADRVVLSVYIRLDVEKSVEMSDDFVQFVRQLEKDGRDVVVISFAKLTILDTFPNLETFMLACGGRPFMHRAAESALVALISISARLPLSLPPHHRRGDGLDRQVSLSPDRLVFPG